MSQDSVRSLMVQGYMRVLQTLNVLRRNGPLLRLYDLYPIESSHFHISLLSNPKIAISIACPIDMLMCGTGFLETALIINNEISYDTDVGYGDICRFGSNDDLIQHLLEIAPKLNELVIPNVE
jgi:hypothetical protein